MTFAERGTTAVTAATLALLAVPVHAVRRRKDDCGNDQTDDEISRHGEITLFCFHGARPHCCFYWQQRYSLCERAYTAQTLLMPAQLQFRK